METTSDKPNHGLYLFGVTIAVLSFATYMALQTFITLRSEDSLFFINYAFFCILFFVAFLGGTLSFFGFIKSYKNHIVFPLMVAGTISCFALNHEVSVFYDSCTWLCYVLIVMNIVVLCIPYLSHFPKILQYLCYIILGIAWLVYLYFSIILMPIYGIGAIGMIALGLGVHAFVPLICLIALTVFLLNLFKKERKLVYTSIITVCACLLFVVIFMVRWNTRANLINSYKQEMNLQAPGALPEWVYMAQQIPSDDLTKKVLMSDVLYANIHMFWGGDWDFGFRRLNIEAERVHDPLITLGTIISEKINFSNDEVIKIMEAKYDIRHLTESRLWTGKDLRTNTITSNVRIYPDLRLAYTEKIMTVENRSEYSWQQEEAIYTFYLPEGATVSSLSLWINGVEEKAALTTTGKADSAYTTIVGGERRDPSVVHWQEGNKVSVRVFPCLTNEPRQFKIGITSPLEKENDKLVYKNIYFKGPDASSAHEIAQVNYTDDVTSLQQPSYFDKISKHTYKAKHRYDASWQVTFDAPAIKPNEYQLGNNSYTVVAYENQTIAFEPGAFYLDVNAAWTKDEWDNMLKAAGKKTVYVFTDHLETVTEENEDDLFTVLHNKQFSLFPFYKLDDPETALVITKSNGLSPNLDELKNTKFSNEEKEFFSQYKNIKVCCINSELTPYLKTLQEFRAIQLYSASADQITSMIRENKFIKNPENDSCVYISSAGITISKQPAATLKPNKFPDHIFRLYSYNTVLRQLNTDYYMDDSLNTDALATASMANVVSPISSLIVLETQADYDRFNISKDPNSIGNASIHSDGSVPEPHEWALIIIAAISLFYIYTKKTSLCHPL